MGFINWGITGVTINRIRQREQQCCQVVANLGYSSCLLGWVVCMTGENKASNDEKVHHDNNDERNRVCDKRVEAQPNPDFQQPQLHAQCAEINQCVAGELVWPGCGIFEDNKPVDGETHGDAAEITNGGGQEVVHPPPIQHGKDEIVDEGRGPTGNDESDELSQRFFHRLAEKYFPHREGTLLPGHPVAHPGCALEGVRVCHVPVVVSNKRLGVGKPRRKAQLVLGFLDGHV
jgi:hypothetical protein